MQLRQGDVFLEKVDALPEGVKPVKMKVVGKHLVIAEGGETIHAHVMEKEDVQTWEIDGKTFIEVKSDTLLKIMEPHKVTVPRHFEAVVEKAIYEIVPQKSYTPERVKNVVD
jgi:hypothetical protein